MTKENNSKDNPKRWHQDVSTGLNSCFKLYFSDVAESKLADSPSILIPGRQVTYRHFLTAPQGVTLPRIGVSVETLRTMGSRLDVLGFHASFKDSLGTYLLGESIVQTYGRFQRGGSPGGSPAGVQGSRGKIGIYGPSVEKVVGSAERLGVEGLTDLLAENWKHFKQE